MTSTLWKVQIPDAESGAHKYDDVHIPYDAVFVPYDGTGQITIWDQQSGQ